ncbi:MAG: hypothetical protein AAB152_08345 [Candidatus Coatesbacteria bacterium]
MARLLCRRRGAVLAAAGVLVLLAGHARADACLQEGWDDGSVSPMNLYPNWTKVLVASDQLWLYPGVPGTEIIQGITIVNFGTAVDTDFSRVYVELECGATSSGLLTLTYRGVYPTDAGPAPAWTWAGNTPDFSGCPDLCGNPACGGFLTMSIYVDVAQCPADGASVRFGLTSQNWEGGITDNSGCHAPSGASGGAGHTIRYVYTEGPANAVPGDTIWFTIWYGRPGSGNLSGITILDTLPAYTHFVQGSASPPADVGYDPEWGPPPVLRWTFPGPLATGGGPTGSITFAVTVDWGNGEGFEPGSGDVAAPEGARVENRAGGAFEGAACPRGFSDPAQTVVRRFLMWLIGDNDLLFSQALGQSPDEMVYGIFIKNLSETKTWWDVRVWDTVPPQLDTWCINCGFDDPCTGWTMTPSGCAAASPGRLTPGTKTIMTWRLDMPPGATIALRWKAQVKASTMPGDTAINVMSLLEMGKTGIVSGTGQSGQPANFAHLAPIVLPVTYVSYLNFVASSKNHEQPSRTTFFPLNKKTQFELRALEDVADAFAIGGGVSTSIGCLIGDCIGGFPGSGGKCPAGGIGSGPGSQAGCKVERIPAIYDSLLTTAYPFQHLYKLTSNAPVAWMNMQAVGAQCSDYHMYGPSSTLTYTGLIHYGWKTGYGSTVGTAQGTTWVFINTGKTPYGAVDTTVPTTVHVFQFNYATLAWDYVTTYDIAGESIATFLGTTDAQEGAYRSVSSQSQLIVWQGYNMMSTLGCGCPCYNVSTVMPTRESGGVVGLAGQTFYGSTCGSCNPPRADVGNVGGADATYRVSVYVPDTTVGPAALPANIRGTSGKWMLKGTNIAPWGLLTALNPRLYPNDGTLFDNPGNTVYRVEHLGGGAIQIFHGIKIFTGYGGGAVLNATDGKPTGAEFWVNQSEDKAGTNGTSPELYSINVFCPKTGMAIKMETDDGRTETYTTNGPDQCVAFIGFVAPARKRNIRMTRLAAGAPGDVLCIYNSANEENPGLTAPFLQQGVHYTIVAPQVVYAGQSFWITVIVSEVGGATKTDYCGTTSFSSTDPAAKVESIAMDAYNYTWDSNIAGAPCVGAGCTGTCDNGIKLFFNVRLDKLGMQTLVATDVFDGSVTGLAACMVVGADVKLLKEPRFTVAASGDTVQFRICWSNYSSGSGFSFVMTDAVPSGLTYLPEAAVGLLDCKNTTGLPLSVSYSTATTPNMPAAASFTGGNPTAGTRWLRWTVQYAAVGATGCGCYRATIN